MQRPFELMHINIRHEAKPLGQLFGVQNLHGPTPPLALPVQAGCVENTNDVLPCFPDRFQVTV